MVRHHAPQRPGLLPQPVGERGVEVQVAAGRAALGAVLAGDGEARGREERVDVRDRAPRDEGQRAARGPPQPLEQLAQRRVYAHRVRPLGEAHEGAVDIEEDGGVVRDGGHRLDSRLPGRSRHVPLAVEAAAGAGRPPASFRRLRMRAASRSIRPAQR